MCTTPNLSWFPWSSEVHTCLSKILRGGRVEQLGRRGFSWWRSPHPWIASRAGGPDAGPGACHVVSHGPTATVFRPPTAANWHFHLDGGTGILNGTCLQARLLVSNPTKLLPPPFPMGSCSSLFQLCKWHPHSSTPLLRSQKSKSSSTPLFPFYPMSVPSNCMVSAFKT